MKSLPHGKSNVRVLLDTHAFLWWLDGDRQMPVKVRRIVGDETHAVLVSAATAWEISTKVRIGRLPGAVHVAADIRGCIMRQRFSSLDITVLHAQRACGLPGTHRDPFDRMLAAQAQIEDLPIVSNDVILDQFGIKRIW
jgi:PIN domain nuclease of toxin-antitoxin system